MSGTNYLFFLVLLHITAALENVVGTGRGQVTNTALLQSTATERGRGLGLLPNGCDVHTGEDNKVSKRGV